MGKYFGTDGFRGEVGIDLKAEHAFEIGRYLGYYLSTLDKDNSKRARVLIGKDTRLSSEMLESAIASGFAASGTDVYLLGVAPTPCVSYITSSEKFDLGVIITASHNPHSDNGIKIISSLGNKINDDLTDLMENHLDLPTGENPLPSASGDKIGRITSCEELKGKYIELVSSLATHRYDGLRIGLDTANGAAYKTARAVLTSLGAEIIAIGCDPDGLNINKECGSTHTERLANLITEYKLDLGFAYDGDADRCIAIDKNGNVVNGDGILFLLAKRYKRNMMLKNDTVVATVMSNGGLAKSLAKHGISVVMTQVGDRIVYEKMTDLDATLGGEQSGHIIIRTSPLIGDGLLTSIAVIEEIIDSSMSLDEIVSDLTLYPQRSANVTVSDKDAVVKSPELATLIESVKSSISENSRIMVRKSGTEPMVRVMVESESDQMCSFAVNKIVHFLNAQEKKQ